MLIFSRCLSVLALNFEFISSFNWALGIKETVTPSPLFLTVGVGWGRTLNFFLGHSDYREET